MTSIYPSESALMTMHAMYSSLHIGTNLRLKCHSVSLLYALIPQGLYLGVQRIWVSAIRLS